MTTAILTRRAVLLGGVGTAAGLLTGCGDEAPAPPAGGAEPASAPWTGPVEQVSVTTGVGWQGREALLPAAAAKGFFAHAGLEVKVLPGKGTSENLKLLMSGAATFATLDTSGAIIEMSRPGGIGGFWLTSLLHRRNLACFMGLPGKIRTSADLAGRTITFVPGGINKVLFGTYARLSGFDPSTVKWQQAGPLEHAKLLASGRVDAISQFVPARVAVEAVTGGPVTVLPFTDILGDIHGSAIAVTDKTARERPDLVRRFNHALLRGLRYALDNPQETAEIYLAQPEAKTQKLPAVLGEINSLAQYVHLSTQAPQTAPLGHFDATRLMQNISILQGAGQIPAGLKPEQVVRFDLAGDPVT